VNVDAPRDRAHGASNAGSIRIRLLQVLFSERSVEKSHQPFLVLIGVNEHSFHVPRAVYYPQVGSFAGGFIQAVGGVYTNLT